MSEVDYFIVVIKEGEEPIVLPERYDNLEIAKNCCLSVAHVIYNDCVVNLMEDDSSEVKVIEKFNGMLDRN